LGGEEEDEEEKEKLQNEVHYMYTFHLILLGWLNKNS
jgi:hypothetical protein